MKSSLLVLSSILLLSCSNKRDIAIEEIRNAETAFNALAADSGIAKAFIHFAAPDAVLLRGETLYDHPDSIKTYVMGSAEKYPDAVLTWEPHFIDAAQSGELGYTYGTYLFAISDTSTPTSGYFHTVWKKQGNGEWKFVWD